MIQKIMTMSLVAAGIACAAPDFNLYSAHRAMRADDILTVIIDENAKAGSQSSTNTKKENSLGLDISRGGGALDFIPSAGAKGGVNVGFDGKGGTARQGSLNASISARVVQVLDNGNLVIEGSKVVEINDEKEIIKISGIVRPQDIESNNIIHSSDIADAQIAYSGKGAARDGHRPGPIARFLNFIF